MELNPRRTENHLIVVDDFYADPRAVRDYALRQEFRDGRPHYPGVRSPKYLPNDVRGYLEKLLRTELEWEHEFCGCFQIMTTSDQNDSYIHRDSTDWAGVVYLSEATAPGTIFYKHKQSGFSYFPSTTEAFSRANELKMSQIELLHNLTADSKDESKWEPLFQTEFKFNRMVLYPARNFHKNGPPWGQHKESGRLTQVFFLRYAHVR